MATQESDQDIPPPPPAANSDEYNGGFTVLQLPPQLTSAMSDPAIKHPLRRCSSCGFGSANKKRSPPPSSHSSLYEPCSKRPAISTSSPDLTPPSSSQRKMSPLRRSLSDFPCSPTPPVDDYQDSSIPAAASASLKKNPLSPSQLMPGNSKISRIPLFDSCPISTMVPQQQMSPSNPSFSSEYYDTPAVNTTPSRPRPPPCVRPQMFHHHPSSDSKKLRRELKGKVEELMQFMVDQVAGYEPQQDDVNIINCINKEKAEMINQNQNQNRIRMRGVMTQFG